MKLEKLIQENRFDEALDLLAKDHSIASSIKNYNKAFLHYKSDDLVSSRFFLEKAQKLGLYSKEVSDALSVVKSELGIKTIENSYYKEDAFIFNMIGFHSDVYFVTIGFFLLVSLLAFYKLKHFIGSLALILCLGVIGFYSVIKDHEVKINKQETFVYGGPSKIFEQKQVILPGMKVITTMHSGDWTFIKYPLAYRGWVYKYKAMDL